MKPSDRTTREERTSELLALRKADLIRLYRPNCLYTANPLTSWSKDELVSSILSIEFPPPPDPAARP